MISVLSSLLTALLFYFCFTTLLVVQLKRLFCPIFVFSMFFLGYCIAPLTGQWLTIIYAIMASFLIYIGSEKSLSNIVLSLIGYFIAAVFNHLSTILLSFFNISIATLSDNPSLDIAFLLVQILITISVLRTVRKLLLHYHFFHLEQYPKKLLLLMIVEMYLGIMIMTLNFVYGEIMGYPSDILTLNGILIGFFCIATIVVFFAFHHTLQQNYELLRTQENQDALNGYLARIEDFYENIRAFRHDYTNILSTMRIYIQEEDWVNFKQYFEEKIIPSENQLKDTDFLIGKLNQMKIPEVKSILYNKLIAATNANLAIHLELCESIDSIAMDTSLLARILGIFLDNAIEAAKETEDKLLIITMIKKDSTIFIHIENSTLPITLEPNELFEKNKTTKNNHTGLGLYIVRKLVDNLPNVTLSTYYNTTFKQDITIRS